MPANVQTGLLQQLQTLCNTHSTDTDTVLRLDNSGRVQTGVFKGSIGQRIVQWFKRRRGTTEFASYKEYLAVTNHNQKEKLKGAFSKELHNRSTQPVAIKSEQVTVSQARELLAQAKGDFEAFDKLVSSMAEPIVKGDPLQKDRMKTPAKLLDRAMMDRKITHLGQLRELERQVDRQLPRPKGKKKSHLKAFEQLRESWNQTTSDAAITLHLQQEAWDYANKFQPSSTEKPTENTPTSQKTLSEEDQEKLSRGFKTGRANHLRKPTAEIAADWRLKHTDHKVNEADLEPGERPLTHLTRKLREESNFFRDIDDIRSSNLPTRYQEVREVLQSLDKARPHQGRYSSTVLEDAKQNLSGPQSYESTDLPKREAIQQTLEMLKIKYPGLGDVHLQHVDDFLARNLSERSVSSIEVEEKQIPSYEQPKVEEKPLEDMTPSSPISVTAKVNTDEDDAPLSFEVIEEIPHQELDTTSSLTPPLSPVPLSPTPSSDSLNLEEISSPLPSPLTTVVPEEDNLTFELEVDKPEEPSRVSEEDTSPSRKLSELKKRDSGLGSMNNLSDLDDRTKD